MKECAHDYVTYFLKQNKTVEIEMKDTTTRYTNDVIATVAFGIKCDSINEQTNEFYMMGKKATNFSALRGLRFFAFSTFPGFCKVLAIRYYYIYRCLTKQYNFHKYNKSILPKN